MTWLAFIMCCMIHPYHRSLAEVQWNAESSRFEVALRVDPRDLDVALSDAHQRRVVLDSLDEAAADAILKDYVRKHFRLVRETDSQDPSSAAAATHWVGFEADDRGKFVWLYFEWERPAGDGTLWIENSVFMKVEPTHVGTVVLTSREGRPAFIFTKQNQRHPLPQ